MEGVVGNHLGEHIAPAVGVQHRLIHLAVEPAQLQEAAAGFGGIVEAVVGAGAVLLGADIAGGANQIGFRDIAEFLDLGKQSGSGERLWDGVRPLACWRSSGGGGCSSKRLQTFSHSLLPVASPSEAVSSLSLAGSNLKSCFHNDPRAFH